MYYTRDRDVKWQWLGFGDLCIGFAVFLVPFLFLVFVFFATHDASNDASNYYGQNDNGSNDVGPNGNNGTEPATVPAALQRTIRVTMLRLGLG